jgi:mRNA interferase HigB
MHVISLRTLREYWESHASEADVQEAIQAWYQVVRFVTWKSPAEVKATFAKASIRPGGRVVFNVGGNKYRIVAGINYVVGVVYVKFVGSHAEYDAIDVDTVGQTK